MALKCITIGTGNIVTKMIKGAIQSDKFCLYGVYSRSEEKAKAFQKEFNAQNAYWSLADVAASDADFIYIASPTSCHYEQSKQMLLSGKHVLCEKPVCSNYKEAKELVDLATQKGLYYIEAMRPVFSPGFQWIVQNLHKIGAVRRASFTFCQYSSRYDNFKKGIVENAFKPELSNGALMDIGVYPMHVMVALFGMPNKLQATSYILKDSIDGCGTALLTYNDFIGEVIYSKITDSKLPCEIQGEEGILQFSPVGTPVHAKIIYRNGETEIAEIEQREFDIYYETDAFCNMILNKQDAAWYQQNTLSTLKLLDEVRNQCGIRFPADNK